LIHKEGQEDFTEYYGYISDSDKSGEQIDSKQVELIEPVAFKYKYKAVKNIAKYTSS